MLIEQKCVVPHPVAPLWDFLLDVPVVSQCVPGMEAFSENGVGSYGGKVRVKVGPISLRLEGSLTIEQQDRERWQTRMSAAGGDPRIAGGVTAQVTVALVPTGASETEMHVSTVATVFGKLGEFGQSVIKRTADKVMRQFVENLARAMSGAPAAGPVQDGATAG